MDNLSDTRQQVYLKDSENIERVDPMATVRRRRRRHVWKKDRLDLQKVSQLEPEVLPPIIIPSVPLSKTLKISGSEFNTNTRRNISSSSNSAKDLEDTVVPTQVRELASQKSISEKYDPTVDKEALTFPIVTKSLPPSPVVPKSLPPSPVVPSPLPVKQLTCAIYLRVSTLEQTKGFGIDAQLTACKRLAKSKNYKIVKIFRDEGISGTYDETTRPGLREMNKGVKNKDFDVIIFNDISRLSRNTSLTLKQFDLFKVYDVKVLSCKEDLNTESTTGMFFTRMLASMAEFERDNIANRLASGRHEKNLRDGDIGGSLPFGYKRLKPTGIKIVEKNAKLVRNIFLARETKFSPYQIANKLNDLGISSPKGKKWYHTSILIILKNHHKYRGAKRGLSSKTFPVILDRDYNTYLDEAGHSIKFRY